MSKAGKGEAGQERGPGRTLLLICPDALTTHPRAGAAWVRAPLPYLTAKPANPAA